MADDNPVVQRLEERLDALESKQSLIVESYRWLEGQTKTVWGMSSLSPLFGGIADKLEP